ncbi:hypothetical protein MKX01_003067 [Papaver californicum]|nr:hypothetical protein MKX01_003067 [Papaver californicum]
MLCFPLLTDQFTNRKLVVDDWKIGLNIGRKQITRKEVSENIIRQMDEKSGFEFKKETMEVKKALQNASKNDGSSEKNLSQFVDDLKVLIGNKSRDH